MRRARWLSLVTAYLLLVFVIAFMSWTIQETLEDIKIQNCELAAVELISTDILVSDIDVEQLVTESELLLYNRIITQVAEECTTTVEELVE